MGPETGREAPRFGLLAAGSGRAAAIVVPDEVGSVALSYQGERPVEAVLGVIDRT